MSGSSGGASAKPKRNSDKIRILVVQLARLGDTLQALMSLRAAKQAFPQLEITMVVRENFADAVKRVPWVHKVHALPTTDFLGPILSGQKNESEMLPFLAQWASPLVQHRWDVLVNWSYSEPSSFLTSLVPAKTKLGYTRGRDLSLTCADDWSCYVQGVVQGDVHQNIHLTDIFTTQLLTALQIEFGEPANAESDAAAAKSFFALQMRPEDQRIYSMFFGKKWVGLQLGTGSAAKTWAPELWAQLADRILERHPEVHLVLLGGAGERDLEDAFYSALKIKDTARLMSLVGKSRFDLWASVVSRCDSVIAADTSVIHLASILGTRVINLSIGPVKAAETGPYGNGHIVLTPANPGVVLRPEAVYGAWSYATYVPLGQLSATTASARPVSLRHHFEELQLSDAIAHTMILRSRIRTPEDGGGVVYEPLVKDSFTMEDWVSLVMGHTARAWYCGWVPPIGQELTRERLAPVLLTQVRGLQAPTVEMIRLCDEGVSLARQIAEKSKGLKSDRIMGVEAKNELQRLSLRLQEVEKKVEALTVEHRVLRGFSQMNRVMLHNLTSEALHDLANETVLCFQRTHDGLKILQNWIQHTLQLARPQAVGSHSKVIPLAPRA